MANNNQQDTYNVLHALATFYARRLFRHSSAIWDYLAAPAMDQKNFSLLLTAPSGFSPIPTSNLRT